MVSPRNRDSGETRHSTAVYLGAPERPTLSDRNRLAAEEISGDAADSRYL